MFDAVVVEDEKYILFNYLRCLMKFVLRKQCDIDLFVVLYLAARYLMGEYDRDWLPDWVAILAGANIDKWEDALEEARAEILGGGDGS